MRILPLLLLVLPVFASAQSQRSARELASDNIREYLEQKIFKGSVVRPIAYGDLQTKTDRKADIAWSLEHAFETAGPNRAWRKNEQPKPQPHRFVFYLNDKLKVVRAESIE